jgi:hypothetical protein
VRGTSGKKILLMVFGTLWNAVGFDLEITPWIAVVLKLHKILRIQNSIFGNYFSAVNTVLQSRNFDENDKIHCELLRGKKNFTVSNLNIM